MDPLSITSACIGLLAAVTKTTLAVTSFTRDCREARSDLTSITGELSQLNLVLELLRDETAVSDDQIIPESLQTHILSTINSCSAAVSKINTILDKHAGKTGVLKWVAFGKNEVAGLRTSLEAYRGSLSLVLELVSVSLSKAIRNDTTAIRTDVYDIKQDTSQISQIMDELVRLRAIVASGGIPSATSGQNFVLQQYLDGLTSYAESVCNDVVWETDSSVRAVSRTSSRSSLKIASSVPVIQPNRSIDASPQAATTPDIVLENEDGAAILELTRSATADDESSLLEESKSPKKNYPRSLRNGDNDPITISGSHIQVLHSKPSTSTLQSDKLPGSESHTSSQGETGCELPEIKPILATQQLEKLLIDMNAFSSQASDNNEPKPTPQITSSLEQSDRLSTENDGEDVLMPNDSGTEFGEEDRDTVSASAPTLSIGALTGDGSAEAHHQSSGIAIPHLRHQNVLRDTDVTTNTHQTEDVKSAREYDPFRFVPDLRMQKSTSTKVVLLSYDTSSSNIQKQEHSRTSFSIPQRPISMPGRLFLPL
jgi:hypothetical protein